MPARNAVIRSRIEAAERELAAAKAELREVERKFEPDALYLIDNDGPMFLARGRDLKRRGACVRATKFAYVQHVKGAGHITVGASGTPLPGQFAPEATFTKVNL